MGLHAVPFWQSMPHPLQWLWQGPATWTLAVPWPSYCHDKTNPQNGCPEFWLKMAKKANTLLGYSQQILSAWYMLTMTITINFDLWPIVYSWLSSSIHRMFSMPASLSLLSFSAQHQSQQHLHGNWQSHGPLAADYVPPPRGIHRIIYM